MPNGREHRLRVPCTRLGVVGGDVEDATVLLELHDRLVHHGRDPRLDLERELTCALHAPSLSSSGMSPGARLSKRVQDAVKRVNTFPVGPLRCLAMISSAIPFALLVSGL